MGLLGNHFPLCGQTLGFWDVLMDHSNLLLVGLYANNADSQAQSSQSWMDLHNGVPAILMWVVHRPPWEKC